MKVVAIIQARMGSSRLPGKVLRTILGKPMLWHLVSRVQRAKCIHDVVIATTTNKEDDQMEEFAADKGLRVYRGSENDIVDRFLNAARENDADIIVRVWGDCPLIDPELIDEIMPEFISGGYDYANNFNPPTYPVGMNFEVYSLQALERIWNETNEIFYRQYPFEYVCANIASFRTMFKRNAKDLSEINLTVDYAQDLDLVTEIYKHLFSEDETFHLEDILKLIERRPSLKDMNKGLPRNTEYDRDRKLRGG